MLRTLPLAACCRWARVKPSVRPLTTFAEHSVLKQGGQGVVQVHSTALTDLHGKQVSGEARCGGEGVQARPWVQQQCSLTGGDPPAPANDKSIMPCTTPACTKRPSCPQPQPLSTALAPSPTTHHRRRGVHLKHHVLGGEAAVLDKHAAAHVGRVVAKDNVLQRAGRAGMSSSTTCWPSLLRGTTCACHAWGECSPPAQVDHRTVQSDAHGCSFGPPSSTAYQPRQPTLLGTTPQLSLTCSLGWAPAPST